MNVPRYEHGLQKMDQKIFTFGGRGEAGGAPMESAEVYDVEANFWKKLPDMPTSASAIT